MYQIFAILRKNHFTTSMGKGMGYIWVIYMQFQNMPLWEISLEYFLIKINASFRILLPQIHISKFLF